MTAVAKLPTIDELAQEIRRVDGNHSLGAGALAEALMPFLATLSPAELGGGEPVAWTSQTSMDMLAESGTGIMSRIHTDYISIPLYTTPRAAEAEWLPIESAPKDGRLFLCWVDAIRYCESEDGQQVSVDVSDFDFGRWCDSEHGGYYENMMGNIGDGQNITHWRALTPPSAKGE